MLNTSVLADSQIESIALADLERSNMAPHPMCEEEPFHFSAEFRDVALRHVWTLNAAKAARENQERGIPRWI